MPDPFDPQMLNRYSYCRNNPLTYVDPDGHFGFLAGIVFGAITGGITSEASGGDFWDGALTGAISGALFFGAGELVDAGVNGVVAHVGAGMLSGGINAGINGGDIGMGILTGGISGGFGEFGGGLLSKYGMNSFSDQLVGRTIISGITGGISAEIYGGSFGDGLLSGMQTGAIGYLANHVLHAGVTYAKLAKAYQGRDEMLKGKNFSAWVLKQIKLASCATRLSNAFNRAGSDFIKNAAARKFSDGLGNEYIIGAHELAMALDMANPSHRIPSLNSIKGKTGVIYFDNYHIDLWDGGDMVGNRGSDYSYKAMYFQEIK